MSLHRIATTNGHRSETELDIKMLTPFHRGKELLSLRHLPILSSPKLCLTLQTPRNTANNKNRDIWLKESEKDILENLRIGPIVPSANRAQLFAHCPVTAGTAVGPANSEWNELQFQEWAGTQRPGCATQDILSLLPILIKFGGKGYNIKNHSSTLKNLQL